MRVKNGARHSCRTVWIDKKSVSTLRLVLAAVKDRDIAARSNGNNSGISDDEVKLLLQTMIKHTKSNKLTDCS